MATTTSGLMTWEEFERLPSTEERLEILEGELLTLPPPKLRHSLVAKHVLRALLPLEDRELGEVLIEAGYKLSNDPPTWVQPDVSFLSAERVRATPEGAYVTRAPDLAVLVVSPSETAEEVQRKVTLLLSAGGQAVWLVYPKTRTVQVFLPDGTSFTRREKDTLSAPFLLPGWEFPAAKLFED